MFRLRAGKIEGKKIPFKVAKHVEKYELIYSKVLDDYYQHFFRNMINWAGSLKLYSSQNDIATINSLQKRLMSDNILKLNGYMFKKSWTDLGK